MMTDNMIYKKVRLQRKEADGYVIPLGPVNLVFVTTDAGMISCGAFDIHIFDKYSYPAVRIKSLSGAPLVTVEDLLINPVNDANNSAAKRGIRSGMTGKEALDLL